MKEGRYQYLDKIGEGGMATVYRGVQLSLDRPVAIKVLNATLSDNPSVIKRFKRESLIIAKLNHPNIIHVIDKGTTSKGRPVFVMEFVEGITLSDGIRDRVFDFNEKVDIAVQICKGVAYAHKLDVVHRDIKPANVIVDKEGFARLLDFGIASFFKAGKEERSEETRLVMGTEAYMAPEQHKGIAYTTKLSDVYSIGVVIYELFSGKLPAIGDPPLTAVDANITEALANLVMSCIAEDPKDRPKSVEEVKTRLLIAMKGQHIAEEQANRAGEGLSAIASKFGLLDVMQEDKHGAVYLYEDKASQNLLVIKKRNGSMSGFREAKVLNSLKHPNLVNILGASKNNNVFIIVMEYVSGGSLQDRLIEPMALQSFLNIAIQACKGLSFAHKNRIFHGNLRPSNILLTSDMQVKISDFGLDEHYRVKSEERNWYGDGAEFADELSDIFSLGAIFYHMLTGMPPSFKDGRLIKSQRFVDQDTDLQALIGRMLARDKEDRIPTVEAVLSELLPLLDEKKTLIKEAPRAAASPSIKTVVEYRRTNWLTILLGGLLFASVSLNVLLLGEGSGEIKSTINQKLGKASEVFEQEEPSYEWLEKRLEQKTR